MRSALFDRGRIAEHWGEADTIGMLAQMGVDPFAGRIREIEESGIRAYAPLADWDRRATY